jgi:uncharacterized protein YjiS (DUF1127 family)
MQYQNRAPFASWGNSHESRQGEAFEIVDLGVQNGEAAKARPCTSWNDLAPATPNPDRWRRSIERATALALEQIVEGLTLHAASMHPQMFFAPRDTADRADAAEEPVHGALAWADCPLPQVSVDAVARWSLPTSKRTSPAATTSLTAATPAEVMPSARPGWVAWIAANFGKLWSGFLRERELRRSRIALHALDDRTLKDIGIARYEIDDVITHGRQWH